MTMGSVKGADATRFIKMRVIARIGNPKLKLRDTPIFLENIDQIWFGKKCIARSWERDEVGFANGSAKLWYPNRWRGQLNRASIPGTFCNMHMWLSRVTNWLLKTFFSYQTDADYVSDKNSIPSFISSFKLSYPEASLTSLVNCNINLTT